MESIHGLHKRLKIRARIFIQSTTNGDWLSQKWVRRWFIGQRWLWLKFINHAELSTSDEVLIIDNYRTQIFFSELYSTLLHLPPLRFHSEDAGIEPRTVASSALAVRRSNQSAKSHPPSVKSLPFQGLGLIHYFYSIKLSDLQYRIT